MKSALGFAEPVGRMTIRNQCAQLPRTRSILAVFLVISVFSSMGCLPRYQVWTDWYLPPRITPLSGLETVAVYVFTDNRQEEDNLVGESVFHGLRNTLTDAIYVSEPVAVTLTNAFADALKARGIPVIDLTSTKFDPVKSKSDALVALSGEILEFWYERGGSVIGENRELARCRVILRAYDTSIRRKFWEKEYSRTYQLKPREPERGDRYKTPLGQVAAEVVAEAVYDPEFILAIGRKRNREK